MPVGQPDRPIGALKQKFQQPNGAHKNVGKKGTTVSDATLNDILRQKGLQQVRVAGDGNCFYRALLVSMNDQNKDVSVKEVDDFRAGLKNQLTDQMINDIMGNSTFQDLGTEGNIVDFIATSGAWQGNNGDLAITIVSTLMNIEYKRPVHIYQDDGSGRMLPLGNQLEGDPIIIVRHNNQQHFSGTARISGGAHSRPSIQNTHPVSPQFPTHSIGQLSPANGSPALQPGDAQHGNVFGNGSDVILTRESQHVDKINQPYNGVSRLEEQLILSTAQSLGIRVGDYSHLVKDCFKHEGNRRPQAPKDIEAASTQSISVRLTDVGPYGPPASDQVKQIRKSAAWYLDYSITKLQDPNIDPKEKAALTIVLKDAITALYCDASTIVRNLENGPKGTAGCKAFFIEDRGSQFKKEAKNILEKGYVKAVGSGGKLFSAVSTQPKVPTFTPESEKVFDIDLSGINGVKTFLIVGSPNGLSNPTSREYIKNCLDFFDAVDNSLWSDSAEEDSDDDSEDFKVGPQKQLADFIKQQKLNRQQQQLLLQRILFETLEHENSTPKANYNANAPVYDSHVVPFHKTDQADISAGTSTFSNYAQTPITVAGQSYTNVESMLQAGKFAVNGEQKKATAIAPLSAEDARTEGKNKLLTQEQINQWDKLKFAYVYQGLSQKFSLADQQTVNSPTRQLLRGDGHRVFLEDTQHRASYPDFEWGNDDPNSSITTGKSGYNSQNHGSKHPKNMLGKLLTIRREQLKNAGGFKFLEASPFDQPLSSGKESSQTFQPLEKLKKTYDAKTLSDHVPFAVDDVYSWNIGTRFNNNNNGCNNGYGKNETDNEYDGRIKRLATELQAVNHTVICLQECPKDDASQAYSHLFNTALKSKYQIMKRGELAVLVKINSNSFPPQPEDITNKFNQFSPPLQRLQNKFQVVHIEGKIVVNVHLLSDFKDDEKTATQRDMIALMSAIRKKHPHEKISVIGDFNKKSHDQHQDLQTFISQVAQGLPSYSVRSYIPAGKTNLFYDNEGSTQETTADGAMVLQSH